MAISTPRIINIWSDPAPTNEADPEESYNVVGLPYGGSKGDICVDPPTLSERELKVLARKYVQLERKRSAQQIGNHYGTGL